MPKRGPFKKDLTPIGRGGVRTLAGKGAREQRTAPGQRESLTGDPMSKMMNTYPAQPQMPPAPGGTIGPQATAAMPPIGTGIPNEEV